MFFSADDGLGLPFFGFSHVLQIIITIIVVMLIVRYKNYFKTMKNERKFRYTIACIGIFFEVSLHIWKVLHNDWHFYHDLPFHLCSISLFGAIYVFFTKNDKVFYLIYFWAFGAVLSVLFPDITQGIDRFRYWQFFYSHMLFLWMYVYMIMVHDFNPTFKHLLKSSLALFIIVLVFYLPFNLLINANYLFLIDHGGTPFSIIHPFGPVIYFIGVVLITFLIVIIWYSPIYYYLRKAKRI